MENADKFPVGMVVEGTVVNTNKKLAYIDVGFGISADYKLTKEFKLTEGCKVSCVVTDINMSTHRMSVIVQEVTSQPTSTITVKKKTAPNAYEPIIGFVKFFDTKERFWFYTGKQLRC